MTSEHFQMFWFPDRVQGQLGDDDDDGIPDRVQDTLLVLELAWSFFHDDLGMTAPGYRISFWWDRPDVNLEDGRAVSVPVYGIFVPATYDVEYLPVHELFHQFQYPYMSSALATVGFWGNVLNIDWWMEATAEWATKEYAYHVMGRHDHPTTNFDTVPEGGNIPALFATTGRRLTYGNMTTETMRHYGAVAATEVFTEALGQDFVRYTWESLEGQANLDGFTQLDDALYSHGWGTLASWITAIWGSLYTACDPAVDQSSAFETWCNKRVVNNGALKTSADPAGDIARPVHQASSSRHSSGSFSVAGGGGVFQDIAVPSSAIGKALNVFVRPTEILTATDVSSLILYVWAWGSSPGDFCGHPDTSAYVAGSDPGGMISASIVPTSDCANVTVMVVDSNLSHQDQDITVSWSAYDPGAIISNGSVTLGVNANGSLNEQTDGDGNQVTVLDNQVGAQFNSYLWPDNYVLLSTDQERILGGVYWVGELPKQDVIVLDFSADSSTAQSIVEIGGYQVVQYFHPSSNSHAYQLDVTVRVDEQTEVPANTNLVYRRALVTPAAYDGTEPLPGYVTYGQGSGVLGCTNVPRYAGLDEDWHYLQPYDLADVDAWHTSQQGFGIDLPITAANPETTLYYGATGSPASAASVVADLGAGTYGLSTPPIGTTMATYILAH